MTDNVIQIRGLRKSYRGFTLKDVDLDVPRGFVTGLIGPNGAGKTTLIKLVMSLVRRDADLLIMDEPTAGLDLAFRRELLDQLTAVLQDERKSVVYLHPSSARSQVPFRMHG